MNRDSSGAGPLCPRQYRHQRRSFRLGGYLWQWISAAQKHPQPLPRVKGDSHGLLRRRRGTPLHMAGITRRTSALYIVAHRLGGYRGALCRHQCCCGWALGLPEDTPVSTLNAACTGFIRHTMECLLSASPEIRSGGGGGGPEEIKW